MQVEYKSAKNLSLGFLKRPSVENVNMLTADVKDFSVTIRQNKRTARLISQCIQFGLIQLLI